MLNSTLKTVRKRREEERNPIKKAGITAMEFILYLAVFLFVLALIGGAYYYFNIVKQKASIINDFNALLGGLNSYYSSNQKYPAGSGWAWNNGYAYVAPNIQNGGWQYSCNSNTITITTPPIDNPKVRTQVLQYFQSKCDAASTSGNSAVCTLYNRVCY